MSRVFQRDGTWWIDFQDAQGIRHRKKIGPNRRIAQEVLNDALGKVTRRQHLGVIDDSAISFAEFADLWWQRVASTLRPRTQERWRGIVDQLKASLSRCPPRDRSRAGRKPRFPANPAGCRSQYRQPRDDGSQTHALEGVSMGVPRRRSRRRIEAVA